MTQWKNKITKKKKCKMGGKKNRKINTSKKTESKGEVGTSSTP
jgi:hypothetical protein